MPQRDCDDKKNKMEDESKEKTSQPDDVSKMARAVEACATAEWETAVGAIESLTALKPTLIIPHMLSLLLLEWSREAISSRLITLIDDRLRFKQNEVFPSWKEEDREDFCCGLLKVLRTIALANEPEVIRLVSTVINGRLGKEVDDPSLTANLMHECAASGLPSLKLLCIELIRYKSGLRVFGTKVERLQHLVSFLGTCIRDADSAVRLAALQKCNEYLQTDKVFRMDGQIELDTADDAAEETDAEGWVEWDDPFGAWADPKWEYMLEMEAREQEVLWKANFVPLLQCIVQVLLSSDTESESAHAALACVAKLAEVEPASLELNLTPEERSSLINSCYKEIKAGVRKGKVAVTSLVMEIFCVHTRSTWIPTNSFKLAVNSWILYLTFINEGVMSPKLMKEHFLRFGNMILCEHFREHLGDSDRMYEAMNTLLEWTEELRRDDDWKVRRSTVSALMNVAFDGIRDGRVLAALAYNIIPSLSDIDPRVASTAYDVLSLFMESPFPFVSFLEHPDLISRLALDLRNESSFEKAAHLLVFITNSLRELQTEKRSFTPAQFESIHAAFAIRLKTWEKTGDDNQIYRVVHFINTVSPYLDSIDQKEYDLLMPPLKALFRSLLKKDTTPFRSPRKSFDYSLGKLLVCMTMFGDKMSPEVFAPDAAEIMVLLAPLLPSLGKDLIFSDHMDRCLYTMCYAMQKEFIEYLPIVMPSVYPKERFKNAYESSESAANTVNGFAQVLGSGFDPYKNYLEYIPRG